MLCLGGMNFDTAASTFRQLMGNGLSYQVPTFQRDYSWSEDEWEDLWLDLVALFDADAEPAHYMGYLVLQSADRRTFEIIDGQQRITTLSLLVLAALSHLQDTAASADPQHPDNRRAEQLRASYIGTLDPVTLVPRSKLVLNRHNERYYQDYLVPLEPLPRRGLNASERLLRLGFLWFKERLAAHAGNSGEQVAGFIEAVVDKLFFTTITVTDGLNAFKVFETLNARGVRLSATDLLKNLLFSVVARDGAHESELRTLEDRWEAIVGLLGSESLPDYLRVFWNSRHPLVRKTALFKTVRASIADKRAAFELIRALDRDARTYAALRNPDSGGWSAAQRDHLAQLRLYNVRQPLAVLLAAFNRFGEERRADFDRFLGAIAAVSFRYNLICGRQPNRQEAIYNEVACKLAEGRLEADGAIQALQAIYPNNREFRAAFADKTLNTHRQRRLVRFILLRLEQHLSGREFDMESDSYNIEHVLPQHPSEGWEEFDDRQREACIFRLGNLTLLEASANRNLGNAAYSDKRGLFRKSRFAITRRLAEQFDIWTAAKIQAHQDWMARRASDVWKVDF